MNNLENMGNSLPSKAVFLSISLVAMARALSDSSASANKLLLVARRMKKATATQQGDNDFLPIFEYVLDKERCIVIHSLS